MINYSSVSLPEYYTQLLVSNIQNTTLTNTNLELYINENAQMNILIKKLFLDIDKEGFLGKILNIAGWTGIRNRLASAYIEYAITGHFPETANLSLINDIVNFENKMRHFTYSGYSRSFLLGFYSKMSMIQFQKMEVVGKSAPLIIKDEHLEFMKYSKSKSVRIDWLIFSLVQFDYFLGTDRLSSFLKAGTRYDALYNILSPDEQKNMMDNCLAYGASINDKEIFLNNSIQ